MPGYTKYSEKAFNLPKMRDLRLNVKYSFFTTRKIPYGHFNLTSVVLQERKNFNIVETTDKVESLGC